MTQDINNPKHWIADEEKVFQRINNGFAPIETPYIVGEEIILGQILVDNDGNKLDNPIDDNINNYEEINKPEEKKEAEEVSE